MARKFSRRVVSRHMFGMGVELAPSSGPRRPRDADEVVGPAHRPEGLLMRWFDGVGTRVSSWCHRLTAMRRYQRPRTGRSWRPVGSAAQEQTRVSAFGSPQAGLRAVRPRSTPHGVVGPGEARSLPHIATQAPVKSCKSTWWAPNPPEIWLELDLDVES